MNNEEKYVTYKSLLFTFAIVVTIWFLETLAFEKMQNRINDLDRRLTRTEAICYGTGQSQPD